MTTRDRPRRDCQHKRVHHVHGTAAAYIRDACRCDPCTAAGSRARKVQTLHEHRGTHNALVDPSRARAHLALMHNTYGISAYKVMLAAGGSVAHGHRILTGKTTRITRRMEARILAVQLEDLPENTMMDARGTRRRLQALAVHGWTGQDIAPRTPVSLSTILRIRSGRAGTCTISTHRAVAAVYEDLWDRIPESPTEGVQGGRFRTRDLAAREGWHPPAAWDCIDTDPAPATVTDITTAADRKAQDAVDLIAGGMAPAQVMDRLRVGSLAALTRLLAGAGREDLALEAEHAHQIWKDAA